MLNLDIVNSLISSDMLETKVCGTSKDHEHTTCPKCNIMRDLLATDLVKFSFTGKVMLVPTGMIPVIALMAQMFYMGMQYVYTLKELEDMKSFEESMKGV